MSHIPNSSSVEQYGSVNTGNILRKRRSRQQQQQQQQQLHNESSNDGINKRQQKHQVPENDYKYKENRTHGNRHPKPDQKSQPRQSYLYNVQISLLVVPCLICLFLLDDYFDSSSSYNSNNHTLTIITLYCAIILYIVDLSNWKDGFHSLIWICLVLISLFLLWDYTTLESISSSTTKEAWSSKEDVQNDFTNGGNIGGDDNELWIRLESWSLFLFSMLNLGAKLMFFYAVACWTTLQCQWISKKSDVKRTDEIIALTKRHQYAKEMEQKLHVLLPVSFSTMISFLFLSYLCSSWHLSNVSSAGMSMDLWIFLPILFTICASWAVKFICNLESSYSYYDNFYQNKHNPKHRIYNSNVNNHYRNNGDNNEDDLENEYRYKEEQKLHLQQEQQRKMYSLKYHHTVPSSYGTELSKMILYSPFLIYTLSYPIQRNQRLAVSSMMGLSSSSSSSSLTSFRCSTMIIDLILVTFIPFLIHSLYLGNGLWWKNELSLTNTTTDKKGKTNKPGSQTFAGQPLFTILFTLVVIEVVVHRYLIQLCLYFSHIIHHNEQNVHSKVMISIILHCAISLLGLQWWRYQRLDRHHNNNLMENLLGGGDDKRDSIGTFFIVMMLASGLCFGYALALPWHFLQYILTFCVGFGLYISTRKIRYMVVSMLVIIVTLSTIYMNWFYLVDKSVWLIPGMIKVSILQFHVILAVGSSSCGIIYALVTGRDGGILGKILQKVDVTGFLLVLYTFFILSTEGVLLYEPMNSATKNWEKDRLYSNTLATMTSVLLTGIAMLLKRSKAITCVTFLLSSSLAVGKVIPTLVRNDYMNGDVLDEHGNFISSSMNAAFIIIATSAPFVLIERVDLGKLNSKFDRKRPSFVPKTTSIMIALYCGGILPISIIISIPRVLKPLIVTLLSGSEMSYMYSLLSSEIFGYSLSIWGITVYSILHYHFPHGGAEVWKKVAICGLIFGTFISFTAPTFSVFDNHSTSSSMFASVSSMGDSVRKHDKEGIWGLITTTLAILLAFCGPLNLRQKKANGTKDTLHFTRLIIFSIMFGCGSSWFLIFQLIGDISTFYTVLIVASAMLISLTYTIASVLGYNVEERDFGKAVKMGKYSLFVATAASLITGLLFVISIYETVESSSSLISLWAFYSFILGLSTRLRRRKSTKTRSLSNLSFVLSWLLWTVVLYSRFGVASIGVATKYDYFLGMPMSTLFTLPLASILVLVEAEPKRRYSKSTMNSNKPSYFGIRFEILSDQQRYLVPFVITGITLIFVSMYTILMRGMDSWWLEKGTHKTYEDVFQSNYGINSRTTHHNHLDIIASAQKYISHKKMVGVTSKLAASGFWTSNSWTGPLIHLIGLISVLPTWYLLSSFILKVTPKVSHTNLIALLPFNFFPLLVCRGIPSLTASAGLGVLVATYKIYDSKHRIWTGKVAI